jgi:multidrug resistance protein, MATE family
MPALEVTRESEIRGMVRLAAPLVIAELGWMAMGIVDTMFVGRVGADALAGVGLGAAIYHGIAICSVGLMLGLDTMVSQAIGARDASGARRWLIAGLWIAAGVIPVIMGLVWLSQPLLARMEVDRGVLAAAGPYMKALNWGTPPLIAYFALRRYLQAVHAERIVMFTLATANLVNLAGNWILVLGNLGAPRMGAEGSGWATSISRLYMAAVLGWVAARHFRGSAAVPWRLESDRVRTLLRLGLPAAGQILVEVWVFSLVSLLVSRLNAVALAANQIALTTVSTTFMMPLGISSAAAVRVGHALGSQDRPAAAHAGWVALGLGAAVMSAAAVALLIIPERIARLFTPDAEVIAVTAVLLRLAAFFQLFDGLQIVATGALRGAGDTRTPMLCHFAGYWLIGLPVGAYLCFSRNWGAAGLWAGLSLGLILIGIVLAAMWRRETMHWIEFDRTSDPHDKVGETSLRTNHSAR